MENPSALQRLLCPLLSLSPLHCLSDNATRWSGQKVSARPICQEHRCSRPTGAGGVQAGRKTLASSNYGILLGRMKPTRDKCFGSDLALPVFLQLWDQLKVPRCGNLTDAQCTLSFVRLMKRLRLRRRRLRWNFFLFGRRSQSRRAPFRSFPEISLRPRRPQKEEGDERKGQHR